MWFAAKEAYERRLAETKRREGLSEGYRGGIRASYREGLRQARREERERIKRVLAERGITLPPEIASIIFDEPGSDADRPPR